MSKWNTCYLGEDNIKKIIINKNHPQNIIHNDFLLLSIGGLI